MAELTPCECPCHQDSSLCYECCDGSAALMNEVQRFRDREPLVQKLALDAFAASFALKAEGETAAAKSLKDQALAIRDFKVTP